jgi:hypothetical protein
VLHYPIQPEEEVVLKEFEGKEPTEEELVAVARYE